MRPVILVLWAGAIEGGESHRLERMAGIDGRLPEALGEVEAANRGGDGVRDTPPVGGVVVRPPDSAPDGDTVVCDALRADPRYPGLLRRMVTAAGEPVILCSPTGLKSCITSTRRPVPGRLDGSRTTVWPGRWMVGRAPCWPA